MSPGPTIRRVTLRLQVLLLLFLLLAGTAGAVGADTIARSHRALWPDPLDSAAAFDRASRAEILVFLGALDDVAALDEADLATTLDVQNADLSSVRAFTLRFAGYLMDNYRQASAGCTADEPFCLGAVTRSQLMGASDSLASALLPRYAHWYDDALDFHRLYARELLRLAALFPLVSSEVGTYSLAERTGFELPDRHFLLSFDDGPSAPDGPSDPLISLLRQAELHAAFFLQGDRLAARLQGSDATALDALYADQCTGLAGWQHLSHQTWADWQTSVVRSRDLVSQTLPQTYRPWFRPPDGQRRSDSGAFFAQSGVAVVLWNIDSRDSSNSVTAGDVAQRVQTLMLLWRRGVIRMHDVSPQAVAAVPWLFAQNRADGVVWEDCRGY